MGSLGGLMALADGRADLAGCHLWDTESQEYNLPFVRRILPGKKVRVVTLTHRHIGLILAAGNPHGIQRITDLQRPEVRLANRQSGSGTRVWLDQALARHGITPARVNGYTNEFDTHSAIAQTIADKQADVGIGLESAAGALGLDFIFQTKERYDLVALDQEEAQPDLRALLSWLKTPAAHTFINQYQGYDPRQSGQEVC
jgi:putative molybdopterin biosynthesis protein